MGRKKITVEQLRAEVDKILEEYSDDVDKALDLSAIQFAKIGKKELQSSSPVGKKTASPGRYKKGWAYKKVKSKSKTGAIVYNMTDYQLTHLLEHGHALRQGGRSPAIVHIAPVEEKINDDFVENVKERLETMK